MTKRRLDTHEECLRAFSAALRKEIKEELKFWQRQDPQLAHARRLAYCKAIRILKEKAAEFNIPLVDLGLADYDVPKITEL